MRILLALVGALVLAAPAAAREQIVARGQFDGAADATTLTLADPRTVEARPGSVTLPGDVWSIEGSPDGSRFAALGREARSGKISIVDTQTLQPVGAPIEVEGIPITAMWQDPGRLLVITDRDPSGLKARVAVIDTVSRSVVGSTDLRGAPGDAMRIGDRLVVVDTNRRRNAPTFTPVVRVFAADGTQERTISLKGLKSRAGQRLTYVHLRPGGGTLTVFAAASGRFGTLDELAGRLIAVRDTGLRSERPEVLLSSSSHHLLIAKGEFGRHNVFVVKKRTGKARLLRRSENPRTSGSGYFAGHDALRRYDAVGRLLWTALEGSAFGSCPTQRYGGVVYVCDRAGQVHALSVPTGHEYGVGPAPQSYPGMIGEAHGGYFFPYNLGGTELDP
jgi:hypothetical protein